LANELGPGSRFANYIIEEQVGKGGMGVVYRARHELLGRVDALKVLSPDLSADQEFRARFIRESRAAATVEEPHILPVYDAGEFGGVLYIASRFVASGDLANLLRRTGGMLPPDRAMSLITQVASALDAAHAAGLVHRDVKPLNILVDAWAGRPEHAYLSDFGLTKITTSSTRLTSTGQFFGTPDYCAPEQILGGTVEGRTDQYALACTAFQLLTGQPPFARAAPMAIMYAQVNSPPPAATAVRPDLPPAVDRVLARALAKAPLERFASCTQFADSLRGALAAPVHSPTVPPRPGPANPTPPAAPWPQPSRPSERLEPSRFPAAPDAPTNGHGPGLPPSRRRLATLLIALGSAAALAVAGFVGAALLNGGSGPSHQSGNSPSASATSSHASAAAAGPTASGSKLLACMVTDTGGINDKSFNQSAWEGMQEAAAANSNVTIRNIQSIPPNTDYSTNINAFIGEKCGIIVTVGFLMSDATRAAAQAHPDQHFAIVDYPYSPALSNVDSLVFNTVQDGFLGGYLAAGLTKTGKVATFGGQELPTVTIYMDGFWDGVQYYNSQHATSVQVLGWNEPTQQGTFSGDFTNETKGQTVTQTFIAEGADIIFPVAGNAGLGAAKAVQQADAQGGKVYMLWPDTDGCVSAAQYCPYFISSVTKGIAAVVKTAVLSAQAGSFRGGAYIGDLANGGAALAPFHDFASTVPATLQAELAQVAGGITSGSIQTPTKSPVG
jgi:basic membrane protein A